MYTLLIFALVEKSELDLEVFWEKETYTKYI